MTGTILLIGALVLIPMVLQIFVMNMCWGQIITLLQRSGDRPPFTAVVEIAQLGPEPRAVARLLDRATRLDFDEIDALIDARGGRLPLPMSQMAALRLVDELQQLGGRASILPASARTYAADR